MWKCCEINLLLTYLLTCEITITFPSLILSHNNVRRIDDLICVISGTIYQEVISYNSANDIPSPVDGNGEINASSSSSSISSGAS